MNRFWQFLASVFFMVAAAAAQGVYSLGNGEDITVNDDNTWTSSSGFSGFWDSNGVNIDLGNGIVMIKARNAGIGVGGTCLGGGGGSWCRTQ